MNLCPLALTISQQDKAQCDFHMKPSIKILFTLALFVLCSLSFLLIKRISNMGQAAHWVNHSNVVRLALSETLSMLKDAEADQRGFLLSKDSAFLEHYNLRQERLHKHLDSLRALVSDNPTQLKQADTLQTLVNIRLQLLQGLMTDYGVQAPATMPKLKTDLLAGKQVMDAVKDRLQLMETIEQQLLRQRTTESQQYGFTTPLHTVLLTAAALLIILFALYKLRKQLLLSHQLSQLADQKAQKAGSLLENAERVAGMASWEWNLATQKVDRSDNLYRLFGYEPGNFETGTDSFLPLVDEEDRSHLLQKLEQCRNQDVSTSTCQFWITRKDLSRRYLQCIFQFNKNEKGEDILTGTMQDITEEHLLRQEAQQRAYLAEQVVEHNVDMIMIVDTHLRLTLWNKALEEAFGLSRQEVLGRKLTDVFPYLEGDIKLRLTQEALQGKETLRQQVPFLKSQKTGQASYIPIRDGKGAIEGVLIITHDITELKQAAGQLKESNIRFEQAEEAGHLGSYRRNIQTGEITASENLYRLFGFEPGSVTPTIEMFSQMLHPEDQLQTMETIQNNLETGVHTPIRCRIIRNDGAIRYIKVSAMPVQNEKGETVLYGSVLDTTDEELLQQQLEQRTALMESIIENSDNFITAIDTDMRFIIWNKTIEKAIGLRKEDVIGKKLLEVYPSVENHPNYKLVQAGLRGKPSYSKEFTDPKTGVTAEISHIPLRDNEGKVTGLLIVSYDITEKKKAAQRLEKANTDLQLRNKALQEAYALNRHMITELKKAEKELKEKNRQLQQSNEELTSFNYIASHDLQEPLRKIQTFASYLEATDENLSEQGKSYVKRMQVAAARMRALINDLLAYSKIDIEIEEPKQVDLNSILKCAQSSLSSSIDEKGAIIIADELPVVKGVSFKLQQLFENLIGNAVKYCAPGVVPVVNITSEKVLAGKDAAMGLQPDTPYFHISFKDNGIGFEQEYANKIFELFQRLHKQNEYPGTGLGLAICKKIVHNLGGHIQASSSPGEGSVFEIFLPVGEVLEAA
jgi:PAS domain S-box-containing protein